MNFHNNLSKAELKTARSNKNELTPPEQILLAIDTPKHLGKRLSGDHPYRIGDVVWITTAVKANSARAIVVGQKKNEWLKLRTCNSQIRGQTYDQCCHYTNVVYSNDLQLGYGKDKPKFVYSPSGENIANLRENLDELLKLNRHLVSENKRFATHLAVMRSLNKNFEIPEFAAVAEAVIEATKQKTDYATRDVFNIAEKPPTSPKQLD